MNFLISKLFFKIQRTVHFIKDKVIRVFEVITDKILQMNKFGGIHLVNFGDLNQQFVSQFSVSIKLSFNIFVKKIRILTLKVIITIFKIYVNGLI